MHTEVDVPNPKFELVPGMYASVKIPLHSAAQVLTIPVQAVQITGEGRGIAMIVGPGDKLERRELTLGLQSSTDIEVTKGLQENEAVVFGSLNQYRPGEIIAPKSVEPARME
jgi:membrane fusion protein (multidrug efflux system)